MKSRDKEWFPFGRMKLKNVEGVSLGKVLEAFRYGGLGKCVFKFRKCEIKKLLFG